MKTASILRHLGTVVLLALASLLCDGCHRPGTAPEAISEDILAYVDGQPVTVAELARASADSPNTPDAPEGRRALLDALIRRRAQAHLARKLGLDSDPDIQRAIENVLTGALRNRELEPSLRAVQVSDEEVAHEYARRPDEFRIHEAVQIAALFLATPTHDDPRSASQRRRMEEARIQATSLEEDRGFGALAVDYSEHQISRYRGGQLGWLEVEAPHPTFQSNCVRIARTLSQVGEISPVVQADDGVYLVRLIGVRPPARQELGQVAGRIRSRLSQTKRSELESRFQSRVLASVPVQRFEDRLAHLVLPRRQDAVSRTAPGLSLAP